MTMLYLWICVLYSMMAWIATGDIPFAIGEDVLDGITGETLLVKTWSWNSYIKSITISRGMSIRASAFFYGSNLVKISNDILAIIMLRYNNATRGTSLILERLSMQADGIYTVEESTGTNHSNAIDIASVKWDFKLNVIDPIKVQRCNVRGAMAVKLRSWLRLSYLYYYGQSIAYIDGDGCYAVNHSHLHGRLLCRFNNHNIRTIIIENVTQWDIGLYNVVNLNNNSNYFYLNVTDEPIYGLIGENVTISWHYSQQRTNRSLQIIHPNNGKMMSLSPDNKPKIGLAFQERLIYNGDITICYISLTLLNIGLTDSGVFRIETTHGITIPGCKQLVVKDAIIESEPHTVKHYTHLTDTPTAYNPVKTPYSQTNTLGIGVPIYVVLPMAVLILALIAYVVWIHQKRSCKCETDQSHSRKQHETGLYITPVGVSAHRPLQLMNEGHASVSNTAEWESSMPFRYTGEPRSMNEYDIVDISSTCSVDSVFSTDKTGYKETATTEHSSVDNFGYLIVTDDAETEQT